MLGRKIKSDPVSNHLINKLARDGILNYEAVVAFCSGPCYAVVVERMIVADCPPMGEEWPISLRLY